MPVAATGLAEVGAGHPHPLEVLRARQHGAQQLATGGLAAGALAQRRPRRADPLGESVAQTLEITEVEDPRVRARRLDAVLDRDPPKALRQQPGELELEPPDLSPQLGAGGALVDADGEPLEALPFEQIPHTPRIESRSTPQPDKRGNG